MSLATFNLGSSISAGRADVEWYAQLIEHAKKYGTVLTEYIGDPSLSDQGENLSDKEIHDRDLEWVLASDVFIAEVTKPSLGVGYETARAIENGKPVLCMYRPQEGKRASPMITGCSDIITKKYNTIEEGKKILDEFLSGING